MSESISRAAYDANLPDGAAWIIAPGGDMDKLFDGIAAGEDIVLEYLRALADTRDPWKTTDVPTLEREYGMLPDPSLSDAQRRARIAALAYAPRGTGSRSYLEGRLHEAGFTNLFVYDNSPAVDPDRIAGTRSRAVCGVTRCGATRCGGLSGTEYVSNGKASDAIHPDPLPADTWNMVFYIGGAVTRDGLGVITSLERVAIADNLRTLLTTIIMRHKPLYTWAAVNVEWVSNEIIDSISETDLLVDDIAATDIIADV